MDFSKVVLKKVPKNEIVVRHVKGSDELLENAPKKPTVQPPLYTGPPQVVLLITKTAWVAYEWLSEGITIVLFTTPQALEQIEKEKVTNKFKLIETFKVLTSGLVDYRAIALHKQYHFTHACFALVRFGTHFQILALAEEDLIRAGRLRRHLGIMHGQTEENALVYRDKILMKQMLQEKGILVPTFAAAESADDVIKFCEKNGFDVVIKPRKGYSSVNTWIIHSEEELLAFLDSGFNKIGGYDSALDLDIETFIHGDMYHVDGIVYDNQVKLCWPSKYSAPCANFKTTNYLASYSLHKANPLTKRLQDYMVSVLKVLGGPACYPFHGEAFVTKDGEIYFCEIGSRMGGAAVRHQIWNLFSIMPDKTFSQWQCQDVITNEELGTNWEERFPDIGDLIGWIFIYPQVGKLTKLPKTCPLQCCVQYKPFAEEGTVYTSRENCVDAVASIVYGGKTEEEMVENIKLLYKWFTDNTVYEALSDVK